MIRKKIFLIYLVVVTLWACKEVAPSNDPILTREQARTERGQDVEIIYSDSARVKVRVMGKTMLYYTGGSPRQEFTEGVRVVFYDPLLQEQGVLTGKYAIRDESKRQTIVRDSVIWQSATDGRLETEELIWDENLNTITSNKFVKIVQPSGQTLFGYGFSTNSQLTQWQIKMPSGTLPVNKMD